MSATKIGENTTTICHIKPNIYTQKTKFASHKQYLFRLFTSRNAKKTQTDQSMPHVFLLCRKKIDPQTFKNGSCKNFFFQCLVIGTTCFDECLLFYVITGRHFFVVVVLCLGFLSRTFTIHRTAGEGRGYLFNSSLPLPPASQTPIH